MSLISVHHDHIVVIRIHSCNRCNRVTSSCRVTYFISKKNIGRNRGYWCWQKPIRLTRSSELLKIPYYLEHLHDNHLLVHCWPHNDLHLLVNCWPEIGLLAIAVVSQSTPVWFQLLQCYSNAYEAVDLAFVLSNLPIIHKVQVGLWTAIYSLIIHTSAFIMQLYLPLIHHSGFSN